MQIQRRHPSAEPAFHWFPERDLQDRLCTVITPPKYWDLLQPRILLSFSAGVCVRVKRCCLCISWTLPATCESLRKHLSLDRRRIMIPFMAGLCSTRSKWTPRSARMPLLNLTNLPHLETVAMGSIVSCCPTSQASSYQPTGRHL